MKTKIKSLAGCFVALISVSAYATPMAISLPGSTQYDGWLDADAVGTGAGNLTTSTNPGFGSFPGSSAWPSPIDSRAPGSGDAGLYKIASGTGGGAYPAGGSIYFGGFSADVNNYDGTLAVKDSTPVAGVKNVVLQIDIGEAWTYDFYNHVLPVLSYNGGSQNLVASNSGLVDHIFTGTVTMPTGEEPVYRNTWLVQWDLSSIATPVTDFSVSFSGVQHAQLYGLQLDQSDTYSVVAVPEPATLGLISTAALGLLARRRRSRNA